MWEMAELHDHKWSLRFQGREVAILPFYLTERFAFTFTQALNHHEASRYLTDEDIDRLVDIEGIVRYTVIEYVKRARDVYAGVRDAVQPK